jgi:uncharacterized protein YcbX
VSTIRVSELWVYPVKSCAGLRLMRAAVDARGIEHDRRFMLVDRDGRFLSQRSHPAMATIRVALEPGRLTLSAPGLPALQVPADPDGPRRPVSVWRDTVEAVSCGVHAARQLGRFLATECDLVTMPSDVERRVDPECARPGDRVGFADGFPFLLACQASLDELNTRLVEPVTMNRFRPNIVVDGCSAFAEDAWAGLTIHDVSFTVAKPCSRCTVTTVDQSTGQRGREPLATLATFRRRERSVVFGVNLVHDGPGTIRVGDKVTLPATTDRSHPMP